MFHEELPRTRFEQCRIVDTLGFRARHKRVDSGNLMLLIPANRHSRKTPTRASACEPSKSFAQRLFLIVAPDVLEVDTAAREP